MTRVSLGRQIFEATRGFGEGIHHSVSSSAIGGTRPKAPTPRIAVDEKNMKTYVFLVFDVYRNAT